MRNDTSISLAELFARLDLFGGRVPLDSLRAQMGRLAIDWTEIEPFVKFGPDSYRRNLMHAGPGYQALVLCWLSGQRSPIHDHRGSSCGVRVLRGTCTETIFDRTPGGHVYPVSTSSLHEGDCCGSEDADIHQISNLAPKGRDLITLHVYSPPLLKMGQYSLMSPIRAEVAELVCSFVEGAGI